MAENIVSWSAFEAALVIGGRICTSMYLADTSHEALATRPSSPTRCAVE